MTDHVKVELVKIRLVTDRHQRVHEADIPKFNRAPEVIHWGSRTFKQALYDGEICVYSETFAYTLAD